MKESTEALGRGPPDSRLSPAQFPALINNFETQSLSDINLSALLNCIEFEMKMLPKLRPGDRGLDKVGEGDGG